MQFNYKVLSTYMMITVRYKFSAILSFCSEAYKMSACGLTQLY